VTVGVKIEKVYEIILEGKQTAEKGSIMRGTPEGRTSGVKTQVLIGVLRHD
jgi:hypothetical protein